MRQCDPIRKLLIVAITATLCLFAFSNFAEAGEPCEPHWAPTFGETPYASGGVESLVVWDDGTGKGPRLYVAGVSTAGASGARGIAVWNGNHWNAVGELGSSTDVTAMAVYDSGDGEKLYVSMSEYIGGGNYTYSIDRWDGVMWQRIVQSVDNQVNDMIVYDDGRGPTLYVGGYFTSIDGRPLQKIAKWRGGAWKDVNGGLDNGSVRSFTLFDDGSGESLYVGGNFTSVGGVAANSIARWDGNVWSKLKGGVHNDNGVQGSVVDMLVHDDGSGLALYVGGAFFAADEVIVRNIAKWDGTAWDNLRLGMNNSVRGLAVYDDGSGAGPRLYASGYFTTAGGVQVDHLARWDGSDWSEPIVGLEAGGVMGTYDDGSGPRLYVSGDVYRGGSFYARGLTAYDGQRWWAMGDGVTSWVRSLATFDDGTGPALFVGGDFAYVDELLVNGIAKWDGQNWHNLGVGVGQNPLVLVMKEYDDGTGNALFVGGGFDQATGTVVHNIAKWDGDDWHALDVGLDNSVHVLQTFDDGTGNGVELYVGGNFLYAGSLFVNGVAKWNGTRWATVGVPKFALIGDAVVFDDGTGPALYCGGITNERIMKWDGVSWKSVGGGLSSFPDAMAVWDDGSGAGPALYVAGDFVNAGGITVNRIARWDGKHWSALGTGLHYQFSSNAVEDLIVFDDGIEPALYAAGLFSSAGGIAVKQLARWNGTQWSAVEEWSGGGLLFALEKYNPGGGQPTSLLVGGSFSTCNARDSYLARLQGCAIEPLTPADLDNNGVVDADDLFQLLSAWGPCDVCTPANCPADLTNPAGTGPDCKVNIYDLFLLLANWTP